MADDILNRRGTRENTLEDIQAVLSQWTIRLQCLRRLHHLRMLASEASALFGSLPPSFTMPPHTNPETPFFESLMPFDLIVLQAVVPVYLRGDQHLVLQHLQEISYGCKLEYRRTQDPVWVTRLRNTAIAIINILYSIGDVQQALALLRSLAEQEPTPERLADLCMLFLEMGDLQEADAVLERLNTLDGASHPSLSLQVARLLCEGQWAAAEDLARTGIKSDSTSIAAKVSLAACCLYTEKTQEVSMVDFKAHSQ